MLILTRKPGEKVFLTGDIVVTLLEIRCDKCRLGFDAPPEIKILREEIVARIIEETPPAPPS